MMRRAIGVTAAVKALVRKTTRLSGLMKTSREEEEDEEKCRTVRNSEMRTEEEEEAGVMRRNARS